MSFNLLNRKIHYWVGAVCALPVLVIIVTGLMLHVKKHWHWVQPAEHRGTGKTPQIGLEEILAAVRTVPELGVHGWEDVNRLDVRPGRGMVKVWLNSGWEVQVDLGTGAVLQSAYRRSDLIEAIHDGSFFGGDWAKLGLFFPSGWLLLVLWVTGIWMFWLPFGVRWRKRRAKSARDSSRKNTDSAQA